MRCAALSLLRKHRQAGFGQLPSAQLPSPGTWQLLFDVSCDLSIGHIKLTCPRSASTAEHLYTNDS